MKNLITVVTVGFMELLLGILGLGLAFGVLFLLTKLIIWFSMGMFNYDLSDKFWYVFAGLVILNTMFGGFNIKIGGK